MGSGFSKMKKQAKQLQEQMAQMQEEMQNLKVTGSAGNGLVEITLTGEKEMESISIKPDCVDPDDIEGLQDLILVAYKDALKQVEEKTPSSGLEGLGGLSFGF